MASEKMLARRKRQMHLVVTPKRPQKKGDLRIFADGTVYRERTDLSRTSCGPYYKVGTTKVKG